MSNNYTEEEERLFLSKTRSWHLYDVDLLLAYKQMLRIVANEKLGDKAAKDRALEILETHIRHFCQFNDLNFDLHVKHNMPIIIDKADGAYDYNIAMVLIGYDVNRIEAFLDYQIVRYKGDRIFPLMIENLTYGIVERYSPFDNSARLKNIMDWVKTKRKFVDTAATIANTEPLLKWLNDFHKLKILSKKLYNKDYTEKPLSFYSAISDGQTITWLKEPETLAYLINKLYVKRFIDPVERNGYIKAAESLFCENSNKSATKINFKLSLDKINRSPLKHHKTKAMVDKLLSDVFPE